MKKHTTVTCGLGSTIWTTETTSGCELKRRNNRQSATLNKPVQVEGSTSLAIGLVCMRAALQVDGQHGDVLQPLADGVSADGREPGLAVRLPEDEE